MPTDGLDQGVARFGRAATLSVAIVVLATAAHSLGHGTLPPLGFLLLAAAATLPVTVQLAGRRLGLMAGIGLLGAAQLVLHYAFEYAAGCGPALAATHAGHGAATVGGCVLHAAHGSAVSGPLMSVLHGCATVGTAVLLAGADAALWRLLARILPRYLRVSPVPGRWAPLRVVLVRVVGPHLHLRAHPSRRGPPGRLAVPSFACHS